MSLQTCYRRQPSPDEPEHVPTARQQDWGLGWRAQCRSIAPAELVRRFQRVGFARMPAITAALDLQLLQIILTKPGAFSI